MAEILQPSRRVEHTEYFIEFTWNKDPNGGFAFPADENGNVLFDKMKPLGIENYHKCISGELDVTNEGFKAETWSYIEYAVLWCDCGKTVLLDDPLDNFCDCGRCYNMSGQNVLPSFDPRVEEQYEPDPGVFEDNVFDGLY